MDNQQPIYTTYISCQCDTNKLYLGHHKTTGNLQDDYLGSYSCVEFSPNHKYIIDTHDNKDVALLMEWGYNNAWQCYMNTNRRFVNKAIQSLNANCKFGGFTYTKAAYNHASKHMREYNLTKKDYSPEAMAYLHTPEVIAKSVQSAKSSEKYRKARQGKNNGMYGKTHSAKTKLLLRIRIAEYKAKTGETRKGRKLSNEELEANALLLGKLYKRLNDYRESEYSQVAGNGETTN